MHSVGWVNLPGKGWTVWELKTRGDKVIGKEVVTRAGIPESKGVALETLRRAVAELLFFGNSKITVLDND